MYSCLLVNIVYHVVRHFEDKTTRSLQFRLILSDFIYAISNHLFTLIVITQGNITKWQA